MSLFHIQEGDSQNALGAIILINDARDFLYPLIQSWPTESTSAETLLVERDGDTVLFLNDLRHQKGTALKLRFNLTETNIPAVAAVLGHEGIFTGLDYRGVEVLSALLPIPDSPWHIVAKMDTTEALAVWRTNSTLIVVMVLGFLGIAAVSAMVFWQRDEKRHYFKLAAIETSRRESEARHRVTLMSVGDGVIVTDRNGIVQLLNPVAEALTGWAETEAQGKSLKKVFQIINEDTRKTVENPVTKVIREGMVIGLANHTLLKAHDGSLKPIADSGAPIRDENGVISGVVLVFRDQTDERNGRRKLEESEEKFRRYFEDATIGISLTETNGKLSTINKAFCDMLGYSKEELTKKGFAEITYPDDLAESQQCVRHLLAGEGTTYRMEKRYIKKNGDILWADVSTMMLRDAEGKPLHFITNLIDITERKAAQKALESSEAYIKNVLDNLPVGVSVNSANPTVAFSYFNENFLKFYRISREDLTEPDSFWEVVYEDPIFREQLRKRVLEDCASGDAARMAWDDIPIKRKGQETTYISARNIPISGNELMVSIVWDTTRRRQAEDEIRKLNTELEQRVEERTKQLKKVQEQLIRQERLAVLGQLAGGVSHELRNPLGVISNAAFYLGMLLPKADEKTREYISIIDTETHRAEKIITDLLDFSRVKSADRSAFRISDLTEKTLEQIKVRENVTVEMRFSDSLPEVYADPSQIALVIGNLLENALQAMPDGGTLTVTSGEKVRDKKRYVTLEVQDTGSGIAHENLTRIFEPLFTTKQRGIGLGLTVSKMLVNANNGKIEVRSEEGKGSVFTMFVPVHGENQ